jgi:hypothetical protein
MSSSLATFFLLQTARLKAGLFPERNTIHAPGPRKPDMTEQESKKDSE